MKIKKELWFNYLIYLSFVPLIIKGISYFIIQLFYPFLICIVLIGSMLILLRTRSQKAIKIVKFWGILIILYGITRIVLFGLVQLSGSGVPSSIIYKLNFWYHLETLLFIVLGYLCLTKRKYYKL